MFSIILSHFKWNADTQKSHGLTKTYTKHKTLITDELDSTQQTGQK